MARLSKFENHYLSIKQNRWYWLFSLICRFSLAYAFIVAGLVKIFGERFASGLSALHPMGAYLEALHHTGYYYTFLGIAQVLAAILLLIPRTVALGAVLYLPIIVNICILSIAVRFEGSLVTSPLMVFANLFLIVWNYDRLKYLLPLKDIRQTAFFLKPKKYHTKFPFAFFSGVLAVMIATVAISEFGFDVMPRNSIGDCRQQFKGTENEVAGFEFCECIHSKGESLDSCLEAYDIKAM